MAIKELTRMENIISFITDHESGDYHMNDLCRSYGVSRSWGYELLKRYRAGGFENLYERSRRPLSCGPQTSSLILDRIKELRYPKGGGIEGAKKIRVRLLRDYIKSAVPSITTIHKYLKSEGLVVSRKKKRRAVREHESFITVCCHEVWTIDFKGHFRLGNGKRCYPLTVCDNFSCRLLSAKGHYRENWRDVKKELRRLFREHGQPDFILSDNGSVFSSLHSPCGYGSLAYWLLDHGIQPIYIDPGRPDQNGRHERMHKEFKKSCCKSPKYDLRSQNRRINEFVAYYNDRPHEGLDMLSPLEVYEPSKMRYEEKVNPAEYDEDLSVRLVNKGGFIRWGHDEAIMVSSCLKNKYVGCRKLDERLYEVYYRDYSLGFFRLGEQVQHGHYYRLSSDRDLAGRGNKRGKRPSSRYRKR